MICLTPRARAVAGAVMLLQAAACSRMAVAVAPAPTRAWHDELPRAQHLAARGEFVAADSVLLDFSTRYPSSRESLEATYWRALYALDPANRAESISAAIASLDTYLADTRPRDHVLEATMLRRVAGQLDALNRLAASAIAQAKDANAAAAIARALSDARIEPPKAADTSGSASADEIKRLKDELAKANAELERIRRRLAQPPPPGAD